LDLATKKYEFVEMRVVSYSAWVMIVPRNKGVALHQRRVKPDINCAPVAASNLILVPT